MAEFPLGNIYVRPNVLVNAGDKCPPHTHNFDHASFFIRGRHRVTIASARLDPDTGQPIKVQAVDEQGQARVTQDGDGKDVPVIETLYVQDRVLEFSPGGFLLVEAEKMHTIEALEDNCLFVCIYAHREPQGDVVQNFCGWVEAYL